MKRKWNNEALRAAWNKIQTINVMYKEIICNLWRSWRFTKLTVSLSQRAGQIVNSEVPLSCMSNASSNNLQHIWCWILVHRALPHSRKWLKIVLKSTRKFWDSDIKKSFISTIIVQIYISTNITCWPDQMFAYDVFDDLGKRTSLRITWGLKLVRLMRIG